MTMAPQEGRSDISDQETVTIPFVAAAPQPVSSSGREGSAKAYLHRLCTTKNWKPPIFECCNEEGPPHLKMFTFKVAVDCEEGWTIVESFGHPRKSKKAAAEDAAEGAVWCLKHMGISL